MHISKHLQYYITTHDHKSVMLTGVLVATAGLFLMFGVWAWVVGAVYIAILKEVLGLLTVGLLVWHLRSERTLLVASLFLGLVEIEGFSSILGAVYYDFLVIYPFFPVFGFFFFFRLRTALWLSVVHIAVWLLFAAGVFRTAPLNPALEYLPLVSMLASTLVVLLVGVIYHISTEITYQKLQHANAEKTLLLREIHHRIKNNLNKIASALGLQILRVRQGHSVSPEEILTTNKLRIEAMSLVHEALYHSEDIARVDMAAYARKLLDLIARTHERTLPIHLEAEGVTLPPDKALRIGTILNELITNTLKHTPADAPDLQIDIALILEEDSCRLTYTQTGHPDPVDAASLARSQGLGMMLIRLSAEELGGKLVTRSEHNSLIFTILFPC